MTATVTATKEKNASIAQELRNLSRLWPYLRAQKGLLVGAVIMIPLVSLLQIALPQILKETIDKGVLANNLNNVTVGALAYLGCVLLEYSCRAGQSLTTSLAVHKMILKLRTQMLQHILSLTASYHDRTLSGTLVTRATSDFDNLSESLNQGVLTSVVDCAVLIGCLIGMFALNVKLALSALILLPIVGWAVNAFSKGLKNAMLSSRRCLAVLNAFTQECLFGQSTIKLLTAENDALKKYDKFNVAYRNAVMESVVLDAMMFSVLEGMASIATGFALWSAAVYLGASALSAGVLVALVQYIQQLFEPLKQLGSKMAMLQGAFTSIDRIFGVLDTSEKIGGAKIPDNISGTITFDHVSFSYQREANAPARATLQDVTFTIPAGQAAALVGTTGGGKSTIIKLLTKLYEGYSGTIRIDDMDIASLDGHALRRHIAIVPQDIVIFEGSVEFNISLGIEGVTRADVLAAIHAVGLDPLVQKLPNGIDATLREGGADLSQGERQLIAFARALARKPSVIVLDEATSSIDAESERAVQRAAESVFKGHTVLVIAHRLATIERCDQILVVNQGKIIERGKHSELLNLAGVYARLHSSLR